MTRILVVASLGTGGVSTLMTNIQQRLDREKINFDYIVFHDEKPYRYDQVIAMGSNIYVASVDNIRFRPFRRIARLIKIKKICKENNIKIVHYNSDMPADLTNAIAFRRGGVKHITMHAHNADYTVNGLIVKIVCKICKPFLYKYADQFWACSNMAGRFVFSQKILDSKMYRMVPNGIDLKKYSFSNNIRNDIRSKYNVSNKFVIGHAGRFVNQKNHRFLIEIFKEIQNKTKEAEFWLFGTGELEESIRNYANELSVEVKFMGVTSEMNKMWQAMDVFVMPSFHEGLPVSGIEAQSTGLRCVFSDSITKEVDISGDSLFISLNKEASYWADIIISQKNYHRNDYSEKMKLIGYDINDMAQFFQDFYLSIGRKISNEFIE